MVISHHRPSFTMALPLDSLYAFQSSAVLVQKGKQSKGSVSESEVWNLITSFLTESSAYLYRLSLVTATAQCPTASAIELAEENSTYISF